jgi:hypothetical protein
MPTHTLASIDKVQARASLQVWLQPWEGIGPTRPKGLRGLQLMDTMAEVTSQQSRTTSICSRMTEHGNSEQLLPRPRLAEHQQ